MAKKIKSKLYKDILSIFKKNPNKEFNYKQIAKLLGTKSKFKKETIIKTLNELHNSGYILELKRGKYKFISKNKKVVGILDMSEKGFPVVHITDTNDFVYIPLNKLNHSLHGDKVEVRIYARSSKNNIPKGEITKVIERTKQLFVGTVIKSEHYAFLITNYRSMPYDIFIPVKNLNGARQGDKVMVKIVEWPEYAKSPIGEVAEILGPSGDAKAEMHAILAEFDLPYSFPKNVEKEAQKIVKQIPKNEIKNRVDFRNVLTFTIDPKDAKDFDDALSFKKNSDDTFEIGVHIADVSYYVKENSIIDKEAYKRGTSVYLVDRVVPMLPEKLSNDVCSLNPHTDKLTFSVIFKINSQARILSYKIAKTIINSNRRFNYDEVQKIIETGKGEYAEVILTLNLIAQKLRGKRFKNGAIAFESGEINFILDPLGKATEINFKRMKEANQLIEEFMLLANRKVAEKIGKVAKEQKPKTFVYRVHDLPDLEKIQNFARFAKKFGFEIDTKSPKTFAYSINKLFSKITNNPVALVIANVGIRAMAKAEYSIDNIGHYGLAFRYYTHFTSPIRRYPDLMVHRLLDRYLYQKKDSANAEKYKKYCKHSTEMEIKAQKAEWASIKYKAIEYMKEHVGEKFEGIIAGLNEWGMFVQLIENNIEGTVLIRDIEDDLYSYDEDNFALIGEYTGKKLEIGDKVLIQVARADLIKRQLDFVLIKKLAKNTEIININ